MKINRILKLLVILFIFVPTASADYSIDRYTIDGGGGTSNGRPYSLTGTIGQPDAGYHGGEQFELLSGFWVGGPLCIVNLEHFSNFAAHWLDGPCDDSNNWCDGADLNQRDDVDLNDLSIIANHWLNVCPCNWPLK